MIEIIEGFGVGAGKSYFVLTRLINHFLNGGTAYVCDTMQLKWDVLAAHVKLRYRVILDPDQYHTFDQDCVHELMLHTPQGTAECPVVIVVDECQGRLNARDWADKAKRALFDWACQSRHDDNDLWFVSQSAANVDKQIRRLATYMWRVRNTKQWGANMITGALKVLRFVSFGAHSGGFFLVRQLDQNGRTPVGKLQWVAQDKELFACYESKAMRGKAARLSNDAVAKKNLARVASKRPWLKWVVGGAFVILLIGGCKFYKGSAPAAADAKTPAAAASPGPGAEATPKPAYETRPEEFRAQLGTKLMATSKWIYELGHLCPDGMVEAIEHGQVRVKLADGRPLFILGDRRFRENKFPPPAPTPAPTLPPVAPAPPTGQLDRWAPIDETKFRPVRVPGQ